MSNENGGGVAGGGGWTRDVATDNRALIATLGRTGRGPQHAPHTVGVMADI